MSRSNDTDVRYWIKLCKQQKRELIKKHLKDLNNARRICKNDERTLIPTYEVNKLIEKWEKGDEE